MNKTITSITSGSASSVVTTSLSVLTNQSTPIVSTRPDIEIIRNARIARFERLPMSNVLSSEVSVSPIPNIPIQTEEEAASFVSNIVDRLDSSERASISIPRILDIISSRYNEIPQSNVSSSSDLLTTNNLLIANREPIVSSNQIISDVFTRHQELISSIRSWQNSVLPDLETLRQNLIFNSSNLNFPIPIEISTLQETSSSVLIRIFFPIYNLILSLESSLFEKLHNLVYFAAHSSPLHIVEFYIFLRLSRNLFSALVDGNILTNSFSFFIDLFFRLISIARINLQNNHIFINSRRFVESSRNRLVADIQNIRNVFSERLREATFWGLIRRNPGRIGFIVATIGIGAGLSFRNYRDMINIVRQIITRSNPSNVTRIPTQSSLFKTILKAIID